MMKKAATLSTFCRCTKIGIDVSKTTLHVVGIENDTVWQTQLDNTQQAIQDFADNLVKGGYAHKILCESTGHYHLLLTLTFSNAALDLRVLNPLQSSKHMKARIRKTKTDAVDAYVLATMCGSERDLPETTRLQPVQVLIRLKQGQLQSLDKQLQRMHASLVTYTETYQQLGLSGGDSQIALNQVVHELKGIKRQLQQELEALLIKQVQGDQDMNRLCQIPGVSTMVAGLIGTVFNRNVNNARAWIAFAGLDVSVRQSGTWRGRGRLTKRGNPYLRKRLYCAAWGAVMNYEEVRTYYDSLKATHRNHVEALCIIARKLLRIAFAILVKGKVYEPNIAFTH